MDSQFHPGGICSRSCWKCSLFRISYLRSIFLGKAETLWTFWSKCYSAILRTEQDLSCEWLSTVRYIEINVLVAMRVQSIAKWLGMCDEDFVQVLSMTNGSVDDAIYWVQNGALKSGNSGIIVILLGCFRFICEYLRLSICVFVWMGSTTVTTTVRLD